MSLRSITVAAIFVLAVKPVHARWATLDDADALYESIQTQIVVQADGTHTKENDVVIGILKEDGRRFSNYRRTYNARASEVKIVTAETINGAEVFKVEKEFIEDKPQASRLSGFDDMNLVTIAFPKVSIGSKIRVKSIEKVKEVPMPGHFSSRFYFGEDYYEKNALVVIRSEKPLYLEKNDPRQQLEVKQERAQDWHVTTIKLTSPSYVRAVDETNISINPQDLPWVAVSTEQDYGRMAEVLAPAYEEVMSKPLPEAFKRIVAEARKKTAPIERINLVTARLAEEVRYMGDWRPIRGGHVPRPLEMIAETKFGDCKDFSVSTAAMLRAMGMKAQAVWVERAVQPRPLPKIALSSAFNHAIVRIEDQGKVYWVDPTNFASFAQGLFDDIIARKVVVLEPGKSRLDEIPNDRPIDSTHTLVSQVKLEPNGDARIKASMAFSGRYAIWLTGAELKRSRDQIDHMLITAVADEARVPIKKVGAYDLKSRVVGNLGVDMTYVETGYSLRTTVGPGFYLNQRMANHFLRSDFEKRVSDLFLGAPSRVQVTDLVEGMRIVGSAPPACELQSPWVNISRKVSQTPIGVQVVDSREIKASRIVNRDIKGKTFQSFHKQLRECFDRVAVIVEPFKSTPD